MSVQFGSSHKAELLLLGFLSFLEFKVVCVRKFDLDSVGPQLQPIL